MSITEHLDKALHPNGTKAHPGQAYFDLRTAKLTLGDQEAHETGLAIARTAEAVTANAPHRVAFRQAAEPTPEEAAELAAAQAAAEPFNRAVAEARVHAQLTNEDAERLYGEGYWQDRADPSDQRRLAEARADARRAELDLDHAIEEAAHADKRVTAAQAAILRGAQARQIRVTKSW
jgi:hypothetical protein